MGWTRAAFDRYEFRTSLAYGVFFLGVIVASSMLRPEFAGLLPLLLPTCVCLVGLGIAYRLRRDFVSSAEPAAEQRELWVSYTKQDWMGVPCFIALAALFPFLYSLGWEWWVPATVALVVAAFYRGRRYRRVRHAFRSSLEVQQGSAAIRLPTYLEAESSKIR